LPVVATAVGGNAELVVPGETGALVAAEDPRGMADALLCYAADAALRQKHGLAARRRVEAEFSIERMVARYAELYESLLRPQGAA